MLATEEEKSDQLVLPEKVEVLARAGGSNIMVSNLRPVVVSKRRRKSDKKNGQRI